MNVGVVRAAISGGPISFGSKQVATQTQYEEGLRILRELVDHLSCEDTNGNKKPDCYFDSGPFCGEHSWANLDEARALLAAAERINGTVPER